MFKTITRYMFFIMVAAVVLNLKVIDASANDLWVNGIKVTDANKNNIAVTRGTARFDSANNTLTLNNAVIDKTYSVPEKGSFGICSDYPNLKIEGSATISGSDAGIGVSGNGVLTIDGKGDGISTTGNYFGIVKEGAGDININGKVTAIGSTAGIDNYNSTNGIICINNGLVKAYATGADNNVNSGIIAKGLEIHGGKVVARGSDYGMLAYGAIALDNANNDTELYARAYGNEADNYALAAVNGITINNLYITNPYGGRISGSVIVDQQDSPVKQVIIRYVNENDDDYVDDDTDYQNIINGGGNENNNGGDDNNGGGSEAGNNENNLPANNDGNNPSTDNNNGSTTPSDNAEVSHEMTLNTKALYIKKGSTSSRVKALLTNDEIKSVTSSNAKVATVSFSGNSLKIKGVKKGKATVTVTSNHGNTCKLSVKVETAKVTTKSIKVSKKSLSLAKKGATAEVTVSASPDRVSTNEKIKLSVSSKKVASAKYDENTGKITITAKKKGNCKITVIAGKKSQIIKVTVKS